MPYEGISVNSAVLIASLGSPPSKFVPIMLSMPEAILLLFSYQDIYPDSNTLSFLNHFDLKSSNRMREFSTIIEIVSFCQLQSIFSCALFLIFFWYQIQYCTSEKHFLCILKYEENQKSLKLSEN